MTRLFIATRNVHKVGEIRAILGPGFLCESLAGFPNAPEVVEDAGSFTGNATKKAVELAKWLSAKELSLEKTANQLEPAFVLADDSGLEVDALGGAPGVNSARFAALDTGQEGNSSAEANNAKLLGLMNGMPPEKRTGRFKCVLALTPLLPKRALNSSPVCEADEFEVQTLVFEGVCEGTLGTELLGKGGFGYDPLFFPAGHDQTFGQLSEEVKNRLSHRARALELMKNALNKR
jgi:XTP/dITP diphosphohydrolase